MVKSFFKKNKSKEGYEPLGKDAEANKPAGEGPHVSFDEKTKKKFLCKVYSILLVQLIVTSLIVYSLYVSNDFRVVIYENPIIFYISIVLMFILLLVIAIIEKLRKKAPINYALLTVFTIGESFLLSVGCIQFETHEVLIALILASIVCVALIVFAFQTQIDFTVFGLFALIAVTISLICGFVLMVYPQKVWVIVYSAVGVLIFAFCLLFDTQLMLVGKHKHSIAPDDYCFAALTLYLDIVNIFYYLLLVIGFYRK